MFWLLIGIVIGFPLYFTFCVARMLKGIQPFTPDKSLESSVKELGEKQGGKPADISAPSSQSTVSEPTLSTQSLSQIVCPACDGKKHGSKKHTRNLVFRFWELSSSQRRDIAQSLNLVENFQLPEPERYSRAFQKAKQNGLIEQLADKITEMETRR